MTRINPTPDKPTHSMFCLDDIEMHRGWDDQSWCLYSSPIISVRWLLRFHRRRPWPSHRPSLAELETAYTRMVRARHDPFFACVTEFCIDSEQWDGMVFGCVLLNIDLVFGFVTQGHTVVFGQVALECKLSHCAWIIVERISIWYSGCRHC